jgi:putative polyketide hydroxylase
MAAEPGSRPPVVIVGTGPAGLVAAVTLAHAGIGSLLVERNPGLSPLPRATAVSTRTMELLRSWGLEGEVRAGQLDLSSTGAWAAETLAAPEGTVLPLGIPGPEQATTSSPTTPAGVPQDHLQPVLLRHLERLGRAEVRFGTELVALDQDPDGVTVTVAERATGRERTARAAYVGRRRRRPLGGPAPARHRHGRPRPPERAADRALEAPLAEVVGGRRHGIYFIQHPEAGGVLVPNGAGGRWLYGRAWHPRYERLEDYTDARLTGLVRTAAGVADLPVRVVAKGAFSFAAQVAGRYRRGRAFLVGDAAQRMTPRGGMGMNTAVAEGHDLAWKLAWVLRGWAGPALLDTYEAEWRPAGARRAARSADPGPEPSGAEALAEDLNGRLAHAWLPATDGHPRSTLDLLGPGDSDRRGSCLLVRPSGGANQLATLGGVWQGGGLQQETEVLGGHPRLAEDGGEGPAREHASMQGHDDRQMALIVEQLAMAPLGADLDEPGAFERPDDLAAGDGRELGHAEMRTSMDASSGFVSTSGTGLSSK